MKKLLLASAVAALSVSAAQAAPTVYGKAFLTVDFINEEVSGGDDISKTKLNSNSSRIGVKGSEALTANTDVVYKLEYGVDVDNDDNGKGQFYSRDTYLGLANAEYGTVLAGRLTSIDDNVNFTTTLPSKSVGDIGPAFNGPRLDNAFAYISPNYNGMTFMAEYGLDSDKDAGSIDNEDQYGVAALYNQGPLDLGASYIGHGDASHVRVAGGYKVSPELKLAATYQMSDWDTSDDENALGMSAEMQTASPWLVYGKAVMIDNVAGVKDAEQLGITLGGKYKFSKAATGHLYAGYRNDDNGSTDTDTIGVGTGLEYKF